MGNQKMLGSLSHGHTLVHRGEIRRIFHLDFTFSLSRTNPVFDFRNFELYKLYFQTKK